METQWNPLRDVNLGNRFVGQVAGIENQGSRLACHDVADKSDDIAVVFGRSAQARRERRF